MIFIHTTYVHLKNFRKTKSAIKSPINRPRIALFRIYILLIPLSSELAFRNEEALILFTFLADELIFSSCILKILPNDFPV